MANKSNRTVPSHKNDLSLCMNSFSIYDHRNKTKYISTTTQPLDFDTNFAINALTHMFTAFPLIHTLYSRLDEHRFSVIMAALEKRMDTHAQLTDMEIIRVLVHRLYNRISCQDPITFALAVTRFSHILHFITVGESVLSINICKTPRKFKHYRVVDCTLQYATEEYIDEPELQTIELNTVDQPQYVTALELPSIQQASISIVEPLVVEEVTLLQTTVQEIVAHVQLQARPLSCSESRSGVLVADPLDRMDSVTTNWMLCIVSVGFGWFCTWCLVLGGVFRWLMRMRNRPPAST